MSVDAIRSGLFVIAFGLWFGGAVAAPLNKELKLLDLQFEICASNPSNQKAAKLECFEELAKQRGFEAHKTTSAWKTFSQLSRSGVDPMAHIKAVRSSFDSDDPVLMIMCENRHLVVSLLWGANTGPTPSDVNTIFDKRFRQTVKWIASANNHGYFLRSRSSVRTFIDLLLNHRSLAVSTDAAPGYRMTLDFDIRGLSKVIKPIRKACHW